MTTASPEYHRSNVWKKLKNPSVNFLTILL
nr:MAG TPA: hypothetical protein [Caudoviricetes sp.]